MRIQVAFLDKSFTLHKLQKEKITHVLDGFINTEFHMDYSYIDNTENMIVDKITKLIIGSKKIRFGNYPSELCYNNIKSLILKKVINNEPIPILVPMGPHKTIINEDIDLAELYALKTLGALNKSVCRYYKAGLNFYLQGEDITGWFLTGTSDTIKNSIEKYLNSFEQLIRILNYDEFMIPFRESQLVNYEDVIALIKVYYDPIRNYINDTNMLMFNGNYKDCTSYRVLHALGWKGDIPNEQRTFYRERYRRHYPDKTSDEIDNMLVNYLAISFAKSQLGGLVPSIIKDDFIQLTFAPPVPGIPSNISSKRITH